jgi:hypothetical protein
MSNNPRIAIINAANPKLSFFFGVAVSTGAAEGTDETGEGDPSNEDEEEISDEEVASLVKFSSAIVQFDKRIKDSIYYVRKSDQNARRMQAFST